MKNKQTIFGPKKSEKNDASMFFPRFSMLHVTKRSKTKPTRLFLTDAFENNVLHKTIGLETTLMKIEQNVRN